MRIGRGVVACALSLALASSMMPVKVEAKGFEAVSIDEMPVAEPISDVPPDSQGNDMYADIPLTAHIRMKYGLDSITVSATYENNTDGGLWLCAWVAPTASATKPILVMLPEDYVGAHGVGREVTSGDVKNIIFRYTGNPVAKPSSPMLDKTKHVYGFNAGFTASWYSFATWMDSRRADGHYDTDSADGRPGGLPAYDPVVCYGAWVDSDPSDAYRVDKENPKKLFPYGLSWNNQSYPVAPYDRYAHYQVKALSGRTATKVVKMPAVAQFRVIYDANAADVTNMPTSSAIRWSYQSVNVSSRVPKRRGYTFEGWYTHPTGGTRYEQGQAVANRTSDLRLYAHWVKHETPSDRIQVRVPITAPCTLMGDGTVIAPTGLSIVNVSSTPIVMDVFTSDAMGHSIDYSLDVDGRRVLSCSGGVDTAKRNGTDISAGATCDLKLDVEALLREENGDLIDSAVAGATEMFSIGFRFNMKELHEFALASATDGGVLHAEVYGMQDDAVPSYQWFRSGEGPISGAVNSDYRPVGSDSRKALYCKVKDSSGKYSGELVTNEVVPFDSLSGDEPLMEGDVDVT